MDGKIDVEYFRGLLIGVRVEVRERIEVLQVPKRVAFENIVVHVAIGAA